MDTHSVKGEGQRSFLYNEMGVDYLEEWLITSAGIRHVNLGKAGFQMFPK